MLRLLSKYYALLFESHESNSTCRIEAKGNGILCSIVNGYYGQHQDINHPKSCSITHSFAGGGAP